MSKVFILVSCRNEELREMSELVFKTIRVGFPTFEVCRTDNDGTITHAEWITDLILSNDKPFWLSDTDIVFFENMEQVENSVSLLGRYEPAYYEQWNDCIKPSRIHTCLMQINPTKLRLQFEQWIKKYDMSLLESFGFEFSLHSYIRGCIIPTPTKPLLYDTCARLFNMVSCQQFTENENLKFEHLHAGTYSDRVGPLKKELQTLHRIAAKNHTVLRGLQYQQNLFYIANKV